MKNILERKINIEVSLAEWTYIKYQGRTAITYLLKDKSCIDVYLENGFEDVSCEEFSTVENLLREYSSEPSDLDFNEISIPEFPEIVAISIWK